MDRLLVPAVVAVITTLLIEYFAKPSLEKRKVRLLKSYENYQELQDWIHKFNFDLGRLEVYLNKELEPFESILKDELILEITRTCEKYPIGNFHRDYPMHNLSENIISQTLAGTHVLTKIIKSDVSNEIIESFILNDLAPLFELAEEVLATNQLRWLPKLRHRKEFNKITSHMSTVRTQSI